METWLSVQGCLSNRGREKDGMCQPGTVNFRVTGAHTEEMKGNGCLKSAISSQRNPKKAEQGLPAPNRISIRFWKAYEAGQISYVNYSCAHGIDPTDIEGLTRGEMECREYILEIYHYLKNQFHELRDIEITSIAPEIGFRDKSEESGVNIV